MIAAVSCGQRKRSKLSGTNMLAGLYAAATADERQLGLSWYPQARQQVAELAEKTHHRLDVAAAAVAISSAGVAWKDNLRIAEDFLTGREPYGNVTGAMRSSFTAYMVGLLPEPRGPKVNAFYHNLLGCDDTVTVDTHMICAYHGEKLPRTGKVVKWYFRMAERLDIIAAAVKELAYTEGLKPAEMQATLWVAWRNKHAGRWAS